METLSPLPTSAAVERARPGRLVASDRRHRPQGREDGPAQAWRRQGDRSFLARCTAPCSLDKKVKVVRRAILWNDQRTAAECAEIEKRVGGRSELIRMVANPALTGFTAPQNPLAGGTMSRGISEKTRKAFSLPKDEIRRRLTGEFATEVSDASGMLLLDVWLAEPGRGASCWQNWNSTRVCSLDVTNRRRSHGVSFTPRSRPNWASRPSASSSAGRATARPARWATASLPAASFPRRWAPPAWSSSTATR